MPQPCFPVQVGPKSQLLPLASEVQWDVASPMSPSRTLPLPALPHPALPQGFCTCCSLCMECFCEGWFLVILQPSAQQAPLPPLLAFSTAPGFPPWRLVQGIMTWLIFLFYVAPPPRPPTQTCRLGSCVLVHHCLPNQAPGTY